MDKNLCDNIITSVAKGVKQAINENYAKFSNLSELEKEKLKDKLNKLLSTYSTELNYLNIIDKNIVEGKHYLLRFENPFLDTKRFASGMNSNYNALPLVDSEPKTITCIGISDSFGQIHLQNVWDDTVTICYKDSESREYKNEFGFNKKINTKEGFFLDRKNIKYYKVKFIKGERNYDSYYHVSDKETIGAHNVYLNHISFIICAEDFNKEILNAKKIMEEENDNISKQQLRKDAENFWKDYYQYSCVQQSKFNESEFKKINTEFFIENKHHKINEYSYVINPEYIDGIFNKDWLYASFNFSNNEYADFRQNYKVEYMINYKEKKYVLFNYTIFDILHNSIVEEYIKRNINK